MNEILLLNKNAEYLSHQLENQLVKQCRVTLLVYDDLQVKFRANVDHCRLSRKRIQQALANFHRVHRQVGR